MHIYIKSKIKIKNKTGNTFRCVYYRINNNKIEKKQKYIKKNNKYLQIGGQLRSFNVLKQLPRRTNVKKKMLPPLSNKPQLSSINVNKLYSMNVSKKPNRLAPIINSNKSKFSDSDFLNSWNATTKTNKLSLQKSNKIFTNINDDNANSFMNSLNNAVNKNNSNYKNSKTENAMNEFDRILREKKRNNPNYLENVQNERKSRIKSYNINYKNL